MKSPRRGSGICLEGWGGDPGDRVLGQAPLITVGLAEANFLDNSFRDSRVYKLKERS